MGKVSETLTDAVVPHEGVFEGLAGALPRERERADEFIHLFGQNRWQSRRRRTVDVIESSDAEEAEEEK